MKAKTEETTDKKTVKVKTAERVEVYSTGKSKFIASGKTLKIHPLLAKKFIDNGFATENKKT